MRIFCDIIMWYRLLSLAALSAIILQTDAQDASYGVDCSFPIFSKDLKCGDLLGDRKAVYEEFMSGCRKYYGTKGNRCDTTEEDRIAMDVYQPQSMVVSWLTADMMHHRRQLVFNILYSFVFAIHEFLELYFYRFQKDQGTQSGHGSTPRSLGQEQLG